MTNTEHFNIWFKQKRSTTSNHETREIKQREKIITAQKLVASIQFQV